MTVLRSPQGAFLEEDRLSRTTQERQSLMNSHRQRRWISYESATTGRTGGMRKAPKRGRGTTRIETTRPYWIKCYCNRVLFRYFWQDHNAILPIHFGLEL